VGWNFSAIGWKYRFKCLLNHWAGKTWETNFCCFFAPRKQQIDSSTRPFLTSDALEDRLSFYCVVRRPHWSLSIWRKTLPSIFSFWFILAPVSPCQTHLWSLLWVWLSRQFPPDSSLRRLCDNCLFENPLHFFSALYCTCVIPLQMSATPHVAWVHFHQARPNLSFGFPPTSSSSSERLFWLPSPSTHACIDCQKSDTDFAAACFCPSHTPKVALRKRCPPASCSKTANQLQAWARRQAGCRGSESTRPSSSRLRFARRKTTSVYTWRSRSALTSRLSTLESQIIGRRYRCCRISSASKPLLRSRLRRLLGWRNIGPRMA